MALSEFNHWGRIADALPVAVSRVVRKTAFDCQANIQGFIRANGQIETGFMLNSVYVVTSQESTYGKGHVDMTPNQALSRDLLPEVEKPPNKFSAAVAVGASYAVYQNYGTRYMPARPFFEPGVEKTRPEFDAALAAIEESLKVSVEGGLVSEAL